MTIAHTVANVDYSPRDALLEGFRREPVFAAFALLLAISVAPTAVAFLVEDRMLNGVNVWLKPLKFEVSLTLYLGTLAWFAGWLPARILSNPWYRAYAVLVVACIGLEMIWIAGAAAFGVASHFNASTPLMSAAYRLMGVLAVILSSATLVYAILLWRVGDSATLRPAFRLSVILGLALTFLLTIPIAGYMASQPGHLVAGNGSDAEGLTLFGWARDGGDLRVSHFFATHAMQFIPLAGLLADRLSSRSAGRRAVVLLAVTYVLIVAHTFIEALQGRPFLPLLV
jgi:hypothetical protein